MGVFVRRVKTASGAAAVQIVHKRGRRILSLEHVGSGHTDDDLALLLQVADERRHAGQLALDLDDVGAAAAGSAAVLEAQARTGLSINRVLKTLRPLRSGTLTIAGQELTVQPSIPDDAQALLDDLGWGGH